MQNIAWVNVSRGNTREIFGMPFADLTLKIGHLGERARDFGAFRGKMKMLLHDKIPFRCFLGADAQMPTTKISRARCKWPIVSVAHVSVGDQISQTLFHLEGFEWFQSEKEFQKKHGIFRTKTIRTKTIKKS